VIGAAAGAGNWVDEAAGLAIAFAQVREDSLLDVAVLEQIGGADLRGIMIASGGCTAAALLATGRFSSLHLVDVNPAQIALSRLKLHLLKTATPLERLRILGHAPMEPERRASALAEELKFLDLPMDVFGSVSTIAKIGPDYAGRYEFLFARLRAEMGELAGEWPSILKLGDADMRASRVAPGTPFGQEMDRAFDRVMDLEYLVRLFGAAATQNSVEPFSRHFAKRTRQAIATLETADNPYLWQMLTGHFPDGVMYAWLNARCPERMPEVTDAIGPFDEVLGRFRNQFDFVHLSNILDWLSPEEAGRTLALAWQALRRGGLVVIRQLNSTLNLRAIGRDFYWLEDEARTLHSRDRSFFYRLLHLGRKP
jgi:S-adenosylmethionine-diacylglycerol 3-amino-3-carboxypropyl transferase